MTRPPILILVGVLLATLALCPLGRETTHSVGGGAWESTRAGAWVIGQPEMVRAAEQGGPALPRVTLDTSAPPGSGRTVVVPAGGNLQAALDAARPGDTIEVLAGSTYTGNFILPEKPGAQWILVRSSAHDRLPPPGSRVSPAHADLMPKIVSPNSSPALATASRAHHYLFIGIEITTVSTHNFNLVRLEAPRQTALSQLPTDITFDRCYIHGTPMGDIRRGIALNGVRLAVVNSYLADFHERSKDSQALMGWNGPGPFKIVNNYLEAAGENVLFGGADPSIPNLVPADIEIRHNLFTRPLTWQGGVWSIKNLFELKNARRVRIDGNLFEHNWVGADQKGFAIVFTPRNQDGGSPWAVVEDITFTNNIVRRTTAGVNVLGWDYAHPSDQTRRLLMQNNLFVDVGGPAWGLTGWPGRLFQLIDGTADVTIDHNTAFQTENPVVAAVIVPSHAAHSGFVFTNNIMPHNQYGVAGDSLYGNPMMALTTYFPGAVFTGNVLMGGNSGQYPPGNFFPPSFDEVRFVNLAGGDYHLAATSRYKHAGTDRKDLGVDLDALDAANPAWRQSAAHP